MTKPMTAVGAMLLVQDGKLDLLAPVSRFLPSFGNPQVSENGKLRPALREIQVRDLLNMTSGCSYNGDANQTEVETTSLIEEIKSRMDGENPLSTREIAERLGEKFPWPLIPERRFAMECRRIFLGAVIEVVSGKRFGEFLKERIFEPLGMVDTGIFCAAGEAEPSGSDLRAAERRASPLHRLPSGNFEPDGT